MIPKIKFLLTGLVIIQLSFGNTYDFSEKEQLIIYEKVIELIESYEDAINRLGNEIYDQERVNANMEATLKLFVNRTVLVYNDLAPLDDLSEFYEIETYTSNMALWYPDGIQVDFDLSNVQVSNVIDHGRKVMSIDVVTTKTISGNYMNQSMNDKTLEILFRIAFTVTNLNQTEFKFVGIRNNAAESASFSNTALLDIKAADFSKDELEQIQKQSVLLLQDYVNYIKLMTDPNEAEEDKTYYKEAYDKLFLSDQVKIYNDIIPNSADDYYMPDEYINLLVNYYKQGINNISLQLDSAEFNNPIAKEDDLYFAYVYVDKFFSGKFEEKTIHRSNVNLVCKISFSKKGNVLDDFLIESMDQNDMALRGVMDSDIEDAEFSSIKRITRKGLSVGFNTGAGLGNIRNQNMLNQSLGQDAHQWNLSQGLHYQAGITLHYMFNGRLGVETGASYGHTKSTYNLNTYEAANDTMYRSPLLLSHEANGDMYQKIIYTPGYDSIVNISYIQIPLYFVSYLTTKNLGLSFYSKAGINVCYVLKSEYEVSGSYWYMGYFPNYDPGMQYIDPVPWGFSRREQIDNTGTINLNKLFTSLHFSIGMDYSLGYFTTLSISAYTNYGITDLSKTKDDYLNIFGQTETDYTSVPEDYISPHKNTTLWDYGITVGIKYKL